MDQNKKISDELEAFLEYLVVIKSLAQNSIKAYMSDLISYEKFLISKNKQLTTSNSEDLLEYLSNINTPATQNRILSSINSFFDFALENFNNIKKPKGVFAKIKKTLPKYLTYYQIEHGLSLIDTTTILGLRDYTMILFLYASGVRVSELINIKVDDIQDNWVKILYAKGSKQRIVPIAPKAIASIKQYLNAREQQNKYVFVNYLGKQISRVSVFKICKKYFNVSPHTFRHSFATSLILGGADLMVVSELLGHSNIQTTQIYTHIEQQNLADTISQYHPLNNKNNNVNHLETYNIVSNSNT
jgi:integrase/recombinase XerD